jgi:TolB-like protein/Flp pilus assembly protein TadD
VLFEMLASQRPFAGDTAADSMAAILHHDVPEISQFGKEVPFEVERVVRRCLEKNREERFQSARDLAFALRAAASNSQTIPAPKTVIQQRPALVIGAGIIVVLFAAMVLGRYFGPHSGLPAAPDVHQLAPIDAVAVLPFTNTGGDSALDYLSDGLADSLSYGLSQLRTLKVRPSTAVTHYRGRDVDVMQVGQALQAQAIVTGRFMNRGAECSVAVELIDARDNSQIWGRQFNRKLVELLPLPDDVVLSLARALRPGIEAEERQRLTRRYTENAEASQLYQMGRYDWNKRTPEGMRKAVELFRRASEKDPRFALAHAGLADCFVTFSWLDQQPPLGLYQQARAEAVRALELDESLPEAHSTLAFVTCCCDWNWAAAERGLQRAIELNPNYATAHQWYGRLLSALCRHNDAIAELRHAQRLDPSSTIIHTNLVAALLYAGDLEDALRQGQAAVERDPNFPIAHIWLANVYERLGRTSDAIAELQEALKVFQGQRLLATLAWVYGTSGKKEEADKILADLLRQKASGRYVSPASLAGIYAGLGDKDRAFTCLQEAATVRDPWLVELQVESSFRLLRSDARFAELRARMQFPP